MRKPNVFISITFAGLLVFSSALMGALPNLKIRQKPANRTLTIFAAASLIEAFTEIGENFEREQPGTTIIFNFAGSQQLAHQLAQGGPADIFASANAFQIDAAAKSGRIDNNIQTFTANELVVIYPEDNPARLRTLDGLAEPHMRIILAGSSVPVGSYTLQFLQLASQEADFGPFYAEAVLENVISYETSVRAVLSKVALGEADAGVVYTSDISGDFADDVGHIDIPSHLNISASYFLAPVVGAANPDLAAKFINYVLSLESQQVLASYGFQKINQHELPIASH